MRVLHQIGSGTIGGAENFVLQLAICQKKKGDVDPAILYASGGGPLYEKAVRENIPAFIYRDPDGPASGLTDTLGMMSRFDVHHFHGLYPGLMALSIFAGVPSVYQVHGARALTRGFGEVLRTAIGSGAGPKIPTVRGMKRYLKRQWLKMFLRHRAAVVLVPSAFYADFYARRYGIPINRMTLLPLGIDHTAFDDVKTGPDDWPASAIGQKKVIGCVSNFRKVKRIDRLVRGFAELAGKHGNEEAVLLIVGDGEERGNIEEAIRERGMTSRVLLAGIREDIPRMLKLMDVFVLPSESESFSIAVAEAMYSDLPVIVFKGSGGAEEMVSKSRSGFVVGDEAELAEKMALLLADTSEAKKLAGRGRRYAAANLTMEKFADKLHSFYEQIRRPPGDLSRGGPEK